MEFNYGLIFGMDKQMHLFSYTVITICLALVIMYILDYDSMKRRMSYLWMGLVTIGILEEYRQYMIPDRSAELLDAVANMLGITAGIAIPCIILYMIRHRRHYLVKLFVWYSIILTAMLVGLIYINESPFVTLNQSGQEKMKSFFALMGW